MQHSRVFNVLTVRLKMVQSEVTVTTLDALNWLKKQRLIVWDLEHKRWGPTALGNAVMASSMEPDAALEYIQVRADLCLKVMPEKMLLGTFTSKKLLRLWWLHSHSQLQSSAHDSTFPQHEDSSRRHSHMLSRLGG